MVRTTSLTAAASLDAAQRVGDRDDGVARVEQRVDDAVPARRLGEGAVDEHDRGAHEGVLSVEMDGHCAASAHAAALSSGQVPRRVPSRRGAAAGSVRGMATPEWVEPMLATLSDERDLTDDWVLERKLDGVRCLAFVQAGAVALRSRNQLPLVFPSIAGALEPLGEAIVDGEIVAVADDGEPLGFQALQRHGTAALWAFDLLWLDGEDLREPAAARTPCGARGRAAARPGAPGQRARRRPEPRRVRACVRGRLGGPDRQAHGLALPRRALARLVKLKCVLEQEVVIGGFTEPRGSRVGSARC